jgi:hypothetical protein
MATANVYILAKPLQPDQGLKEQHRIGTGQPLFSRTKAQADLQVHLWKVCAEVASPWSSVFEWIAFLSFGALSLVLLTYCFCELLPLVNSNALDQTVRALLTR